MSATFLATWLTLIKFGVTAVSSGNGDKGGREGRDFFFDEAVGRVISCAEFCDLPTGYEVTCKDKCKDYIPKERVTTPDDKGPENDEEIALLFIFIGILIAVILMVVLAVIFRKKIKERIDRLDENLCRRLTRAHTNRKRTE